MSSLHAPFCFLWLEYKICTLQQLCISDLFPLFSDASGIDYQAIFVSQNIPFFIRPFK